MDEPFVKLLPVDGVFSPQAVLFQGEQLVSHGFPAVGLYSGSSTKLPPPLDFLTVYVTSHRLLCTPTRDVLAPPPALPSSERSPYPDGVAIALADVRQTEFYAGFLKSSPKITLTLASRDGERQQAIASSTTTSPSARADGAALSPPARLAGAGTACAWPCALCGFVNPPPPPGEAESQLKCQLCGVSREASALSRSASSAAVGRPVTMAVAATADSSPPEGGGGKEVEEIACPACTFLNHPSLPSCELCSTPLPSRRVSPSDGAASALSSSSSSLSPAIAAPSPAQVRDPSSMATRTVRLSFRRGGVKDFYKILKKALADRAWTGGRPRLELSTPTTASASTGSGSAMNDSRSLGPVVGDSPSGFRTSGIDRILQTLSMEDSTRNDAIESSLRDLESLMAKASEMVKLASSLSAKLQATPPSQQSSEQASEIQTTLLQLGLSAPAITQDMVRSKEEGVYLRELARELGGLLVGPEGMMVALVPGQRGGSGGGQKARGIVGLDEVWCAWNRARGVALIPPKTFRLALPYLSSCTSPPIDLKEFSSGLCVLHTPHYSLPAFRARLLPALASLSLEGMGTLELALAEDVGVQLVREMVEELEMDEGCVVRDSQDRAGGGGERWFGNLVREVEWVELNEFPAGPPPQ